VREAGLEIADGEFKPVGTLEGKLVIPFEKSTTTAICTRRLCGAHPAHSAMDDLASGSGESRRSTRKR
jgi:hypothetical protein